MSRLAFVGAVLSLCTIVDQPAARACSLAPPVYDSRTVLPSDGSVGVATNARVLVVYYGAALNADSPRLRLTGGGEVAASVAMLTTSQGAVQPDSYVLLPNQLLQPNTSYQVLSQVAKLPCTGGDHPFPYDPLCNPVADGGVAIYDGGDASGNVSNLTVVSTFTTGAGPDTTAPVLAGNLTHTSQHQSCDNSACCGPYTGYLAIFSWQNASDSSPVYYELSQAGSPVWFDFGPLFPDSSSTTGVRGEFFCSGMGSMLGQFQGVAGDYSLVAVDLAGNRSVALADHVSIDCKTLDGGTPDLADSTIDGAGSGGLDTDNLGFDGGASDLAIAAMDGAGAGLPATENPAVDASSDLPSAGVSSGESSGCSCRLNRRGNRANGLGIAAFALLLTLGWRRRSE